ncbi:MAG: Holliday junction branch migration protein RuvA [Cyclobacteriaceae bacterium]|nr:Holliday junction branch migration protein RuvA [Cyclobacteriaceae bacterium]
MIAYLNGKLVTKDPAILVIDVNGVGYNVRISLHTYSKLKESESCLIYTYLHVKEDGHTLFGFFEKEEKALFQHLISISGVGPNTAMMLLSSLSVDELERAILHENVAIIQRVKGIGAKTAQRIILELKDKIKKESFSKPSTEVPGNALRAEAFSALQTLGINKIIAEKAIDQILAKHGSALSLEELIKLVLKQT